MGRPPLSPVRDAILLILQKEGPLTAYQIFTQYRVYSKTTKIRGCTMRTVFYNITRATESGQIKKEDGLYKLTKEA